MKITNVLSKSSLIQNLLIRINLDKEYEIYLQRTDEIEDKFIKKFFLQINTCAKADAYEMFLEVYKQQNEMFKTSETIAFETFIAAYKWLAYYNVITFLFNESKLINVQFVKDTFYEIFQPNFDEVRAFLRLDDIELTSRTVFDTEFSKEFINNLLQIENISPVALAFINNFFYNSYEGFIKSFTNYAPLCSGSMLSQ